MNSICRLFIFLMMVLTSTLVVSQQTPFMGRESCDPNPALDTGMIALFKANKIVIASIGKVTEKTEEVYRVEGEKEDKILSWYVLFKKAVENDSLHREYLSEMITLNPVQRQRLKEIMLAHRGAKSENRIMRCYRPHHAIYFLDQKDHIIAWIEVCFQCDGGHFNSAIEMNVTDRCFTIYKPLNIFFSRAGIEFETIPLYIIEGRY